MAPLYLVLTQVNELKAVGPIPLRNRRTRYPLLRSPFKHKKSQEIVELRRFYRGLIIEVPTSMLRRISFELLSSRTLELFSVPLELLSSCQFSLRLSLSALYLHLVLQFSLSMEIVCLPPLCVPVH
jgi:Ribosomal protein S10p/S20e